MNTARQLTKAKLIEITWNSAGQAEVKADGNITRGVADKALHMLDVDPAGLDLMDRKLLSAVIDKFGGGLVGVDNLAAAIGYQRPPTISDA